VRYSTEMLTIGFFILAVGMFRSAIRRYGKNDDASSDFLAAIPIWARYLVVALVIYGFIDKTIYFFFLDDGAPILENGEYMLKDHQWRMHLLTEDEFYIRTVYISRTGYATLMPAYAGLVAYFFAAVRYEVSIR
jgi:hypothetical protein